MSNANAFVTRKNSPALHDYGLCEGSRRKFICNPVYDPLHLFVGLKRLSDKNVISAICPNEFLADTHQFALGE